MSPDCETTKQSSEGQLEREIEKYSKTVNIECKPFGKLGDNKRVIFEIDKKVILDLRVSGTAIAKNHCGLGGLNIYNWLYETGSEFVHEILECTTLMIASTDVLEGQLKTSWQGLTRIQE